MPEALEEWSDFNVARAGATAGLAGLLVGEETVFDIDSPQDFALGEALLRQRSSEIQGTA